MQIVIGWKSPYSLLAWDVYILEDSFLVIPTLGEDTKMDTLRHMYIIYLLQHL